MPGPPLYVPATIDISLPFILYIAFQVGRIVQNIHDINCRIDKLEMKVYNKLSEIRK